MEDLSNKMYNVANWPRAFANNDDDLNYLKSRCSADVVVNKMLKIMETIA